MRNKKARDFTHFLTHKSTLLSTCFPFRGREILISLMQSHLLDNSHHLGGTSARCLSFGEGRFEGPLSPSPTLAQPPPRRSNAKGTGQTVEIRPLSEFLIPSIYWIFRASQNTYRWRIIN